MWYNIIKERKVLKMRKPRLSRTTIEELFHSGRAKSGKYEYVTSGRWNEKAHAYEEILTRWDENNDYREWLIGCKGIWEFEKK